MFGQRQDWQDDSGVVMIEGTIGVVMLLLAALASIQLLLYTHAALAARSAATWAARSLAITGSESDARAAYRSQQGYSFAAVHWEGVQLSRNDGEAWATVTVTVPPVFPGAGALGGGRLTGPIWIQAVGSFPLGGSG